MHTIRLRGPWKLDPLARFHRRPDGSLETTSDELPPEAQQKMPADWSPLLGGNFLGRVRYHRVFQTPTGLDEGQRVWLVVEPARSRGLVRLADQPLGEVRYGGPPGRFDITSRLDDHNRLEVIVEHPALDDPSFNESSPGGLIGEVRLEIEE